MSQKIKWLLGHLFGLAAGSAQIDQIDFTQKSVRQRPARQTAPSMLLGTDQRCRAKDTPTRCTATTTTTRCTGNCKWIKQLVPEPIWHGTRALPSFKTNPIRTN